MALLPADIHDAYLALPHSSPQIGGQSEVRVPSEGLCSLILEGEEKTLF